MNGTLKPNRIVKSYIYRVLYDGLVLSELYSVLYDGLVLSPMYSGFD